MRRTRLPKKQDKRIFRSTSKAHSANTVRFVMRGGIRK